MDQHSSVMTRAFAPDRQARIRRDPRTPLVAQLCRRSAAIQSLRLCGFCCHWRGALGVQSILQDPSHKHIDDTTAGAVVTAAGYNIRHQLESTACESPPDLDCCVVSLANSVGLQLDDLSFS